MLAGALRSSKGALRQLALAQPSNRFYKILLPLAACICILPLSKPVILGFLFSVGAFALEPFESLKNVKILRALSDNIVMINRGSEDGIQRNDHAKLSNDVAGYSSRAICLKASSELSYWKLYRIPNSEAFSLDYTYTVTGYADREIPERISRIRNEVYQAPEEKRKEAPLGQDPFVIKPDLPEKLTELVWVLLQTT